MAKIVAGIAPGGVGAATELTSNQSIHQRKTETRPPHAMLYTLAVILIIAWLLGIVSGYTMGNFIHILLVVAIIMILVRLIQGKKL